MVQIPTLVKDLPLTRLTNSVLVGTMKFTLDQFNLAFDADHPAPGKLGLQMADYAGAYNGLNEAYALTRESLITVDISALDHEGDQLFLAVKETAEAAQRMTYLPAKKQAGDRTMVFLKKYRLDVRENMVSASHTKETFSWHLENTMRMCDHEGRYHAVLHRIFYFTGRSKPGICYSLCLYNLAAKEVSGAWLMNTLTGERKKLDVENSPLLTERERLVLQLIREGKSSKQISERLEISKHTVDRHRQNIIAKLQVNNTTEACHKAKLLGLIE